MDKGRLMFFNKYSVRYCAAVTMICALPSYSNANPEAVTEFCDDTLVAVELDGIQSTNAPLVRDLRQRLGRYLIAYSGDRVDSVYAETPLYSRNWSPLGRTGLTGILFASKVTQTFCNGFQSLSTLRTQIKGELEPFTRSYSTLFNRVTLKVHVLSLEDIARQHPCQASYSVYRLDYVRPNPYRSATDLPQGCLRVGTLVGSEAFDTQNGLQTTILNPFTARPEWCRTNEDQEAEAQRIRRSCPNVASVRVMRQFLSASRTAAHLGLAED